MDQPLNEAEDQSWSRLSERVRACLEPGENRRLTEQSPDFERMTRLKRTALRIAQRGGDLEVIEALTRRKKAGRPAYEGATCIPAAMWSRLRALADVYDIEMADQSPVVVAAEAKMPVEDSLAALENVVPGIRSAIRGLGSV